MRQSTLLRAACIFGMGLPMAACVVEAPAPVPPPRPAPVYRPAVSALPPPPPRPVFVASIALYGGRGFSGPVVRLDRGTPDLRRGELAGRVSSVEVNGGSWQLCSRPGFGGRCVVVDRSVRDLSRLGLNNQVESVRRSP